MLFFYNFVTENEYSLINILVKSKTFFNKINSVILQKKLLMKKTLFTIVFAVLLGLNLHAQYKIDNLSMTYGEEITEEKGKIVKIIGEANNKIYALGLKGKKDYFLKIFSSKEMKLLSNNPIILPEYKEKVENFELHIFKKETSYKKEVVKINVIDKEIINCKMISTNKGKVKLVGFYSSVRDNGKANKELKGVYNATINLASVTNESIKFNDFDYDTKVKLLGERRAKKGKDVKPLYDIHSIIEKNDGGLIVLSEYRFVYVGQTQGFGPLGFTPVTYTMNEIIVNSFKEDGSLEWSNVVAKEQSASVSMISFNLFAGGSNGSFAVGV